MLNMERGSALLPERLIVHLDVNKTLIMTDPASKSPMKHLITSLIATNAYGIVQVSETAEPSWTLSCTELYVRPPAENLVSYDYFVKEMLYPYRHGDGSSTMEELECMRDYNSKQRDHVRTRIRIFTDPGQPGERLRPLYNKLRTTLSIPEDKRAEVTSGSFEAFKHGEIFLLPSYFRLLERLNSLGISFLVVLRTFGVDAIPCTYEHNLWVERKHPFYDTPEDSKLSALKIQLPEASFAMSRTGSSPKDTRMSHISYNTAACGEPMPYVSLTYGYKEIYHTIVEKCPPPSAARGACIVMKDDYEWWFLKGETGDAGKLLPMDPSDTTTLQVFYDDNIGDAVECLRLMRPEVIAQLAAEGIHFSDVGPCPPIAGICDANIVDPRNVHNASALPYEELKMSNLVRVDPMAAVLDTEYYVNVLEYQLSLWRDRVGKHTP